MKYLLKIIFLFFINFYLCQLQAAEVNGETIKTRINQLQQRLINTQRPDGSWFYSGYTQGFTALALYSLKSAGMGNDDPVMVKGLAYIERNLNFYVSIGKSGSYDRYYTPAFIMGLFELVDPVKYKPVMERMVKNLIRRQNKDGGWSYYKDRSDLSSCQFVILALDTARRCGVAISDSVIKNALNFWLNTQNEDGGWGYTKGKESYLAMTCAGICSLHLLDKRHLLSKEKCGEYTVYKPLDRGLSSLAGFFRDYIDSLNKGYGNTSTGRYAYGLYATERIGILMDMKRFSGLNWYKKGAQVATKIRDKGKEDTAFLLLFLAKAYNSVAIAKWQWQGDWNNNRFDVVNWVKNSSKELGGKYDWIDTPIKEMNSPAALSSMIFVNGHNDFYASKEEFEFIRSYLKEGGTLVAEACCMSPTFKQSFLSSCKNQIKPQMNSYYRPLKSNHPIYNIKHKLNPEDFPILQLVSGCYRSNVFFLDFEISKGLEKRKGYPQEKAEKSQKIATNIMAWAIQQKAPDNVFTNKTMKRVQFEGPAEKIKKEIYHLKQPFCRLKHQGEYDTDPNMFTNLNKELSKVKSLPKFDGELSIKADSDQIFETAFLYISGHSAPNFNTAEIENLRKYLTTGGFLFSSSCCSSQSYDEGFRQMISKVFPNDKLEMITANDPLWSSFFKVPALSDKTTPAYKKIFKLARAPMFGIKRDNRWVVVYSPTDICCAFEGDLDDEIPGYKKEMGLKIFANVINYSLKL